MSAIRSCGAENALEFHTGDNVGVLGIVIRAIPRRIKSREARGEDHGAHLKVRSLSLLTMGFKGHRMRAARGHTLIALAAVPAVQTAACLFPSCVLLIAQFHLLEIALSLP
jgi:hypothetical protein